MSRFTLGDLDVFYISFDELNCDANWERIKILNPAAKRVHGVIGFDKAHRVCALATETRRFVTIDGDNWVNDGTFEYQLDDTNIEDVCFSFKSRNVINNLEYGNGGIKVWDRDTFLSSKTHENSNTTDFYWDIRYWQIDYHASTTVNNCTPYQAWRAGYREGIKMSYIDASPPDDFIKQWKNIFRFNLSRLSVWCSVGRDIDNGIWAMLGARQAISDLISKNVEHTWINDYKWFIEKWNQISTVNPDEVARSLRDELDSLGFYIPEMDAQTSSWFRMVYVNPKREGLMK